MASPRGSPVPPAGPRADDPVRYVDGVPVFRAAPTPAGGGTFRVDPDRAPAAIRDLEVALAELKGIKEDATRLGKVDPGSRDTVSGDAARVLGVTATGGAGSLVSAVDAGIAQVQELITALKADLDSYLDTESAAASTFRDGRA